MNKKLAKYIDTFRKEVISLQIVNEHYRMELSSGKESENNKEIKEYHIKKSRKLFKKLVKLEIKLFGKRIL